MTKPSDSIRWLSPSDKDWSDSSIHNRPREDLLAAWESYRNDIAGVINTTGCDPDTSNVFWGDSFIIPSNANYVQALAELDRYCKRLYSLAATVSLRGTATQPWNDDVGGGGGIIPPTTRTWVVWDESNLGVVKTNFNNYKNPWCLVTDWSVDNNMYIAYPSISPWDNQANDFSGTMGLYVNVNKGVGGWNNISLNNNVTRFSAGACPWDTNGFVYTTYRSDIDVAKARYITWDGAVISSQNWALDGKFSMNPYAFFAPYRIKYNNTIGAPFSYKNSESDQDSIFNSIQVTGTGISRKVKIDPQDPNDSPEFPIWTMNDSKPFYFGSIPYYQTEVGIFFTYINLASKKIVIVKTVWNGATWTQNIVAMVNIGAATIPSGDTYSEPADYCVATCGMVPYNNKQWLVTGSILNPNNTYNGWWCLIDSDEFSSASPPTKKGNRIESIDGVKAPFMYCANNTPIYKDERKLMLTRDSANDKLKVTALQVVSI
jgi:hypothetical protein